MHAKLKRIKPVCDFCSSEKIAWSYPCKSFTVNIPNSTDVFNNIEDWAACQECYQLIEANNRVGLATRSIETQRQELENSGVNINTAISWVVRIQVKFWESRSGAPIPATDRPTTPNDGMLTIETRDN